MKRVATTEETAAKTALELEEHSKKLAKAAEKMKEKADALRRLHSAKKRAKVMANSTLTSVSEPRTVRELVKTEKWAELTSLMISQEGFKCGEVKALRTDAFDQTFNHWIVVEQDERRKLFVELCFKEPSYVRDKHLDFKVLYLSLAGYFWAKFNDEEMWVVLIHWYEMVLFDRENGTGIHRVYTDIIFHLLNLASPGNLPDPSPDKQAWITDTDEYKGLIGEDMFGIQHWYDTLNEQEPEVKDKNEKSTEADKTVHK